MNWPAYPDYRNSGVAWLGDLPSGWSIAPLKFHLTRNDGGVWGDDPDGAGDTIVLRSTEQTVDGRWKIDDPAPRKLSSADARTAQLVEGDLLTTKSSGSALHIGKTTIVDSEVAALKCCYSNFMQRLRTSASLRPKYGWYLMNHRIMREQFDLNSNSTTGLANLNATIIGQALITVPPLGEQDSILSFLDRETAKIDALIDKQDQLMATLREDRTATVTHAVTKGLNPDAAMMDSGVPWIGEVPSHWTIDKGTRIGETFGSEPVSEDAVVDDGNIRFLKVSSLRKGTLTLDDSEWYLDGPYRARSNFIVFPKRGAAIFTNKVNIVRFPAVLDPNLMGWQMLDDNVPEFFAQVLALIRLDEIADVSSVPQLNSKHIASLYLPKPPADEQKAVVSHLELACARIDILIAKAAEVIATLREYRSAVITAAVTGKIDVRGAA